MQKNAANEKSGQRATADFRTSVLSLLTFISLISTMLQKRPHIRRTQCVVDDISPDIALNI